jgi:hypothetical protein
MLQWHLIAFHFHRLSVNPFVLCFLDLYCQAHYFNRYFSSWSSWLVCQPFPKSSQLGLVTDCSDLDGVLNQRTPHHGKCSTSSGLHWDLSDSRINCSSLVHHSTVLSCQLWHLRSTAVVHAHLYSSPSRLSVRQKSNSSSSPDSPCSGLRSLSLIGSISFHALSRLSLSVSC